MGRGRGGGASRPLACACGGVCARVCARGILGEGRAAPSKTQLLLLNAPVAPDGPSLRDLLSKLWVGGADMGADGSREGRHRSSMGAPPHKCPVGSERSTLYPQLPLSQSSTLHRLPPDAPSYLLLFSPASPPISTGHTPARSQSSHPPPVSPSCSWPGHGAWGVCQAKIRTRVTLDTQGNLSRRWQILPVIALSLSLRAGLRLRRLSSQSLISGSDTYLVLARVVNGRVTEVVLQIDVRPIVVPVRGGVGGRMGGWAGAWGGEGREGPRFAQAHVQELENVLVVVHCGFHSQST